MARVTLRVVLFLAAALTGATAYAWDFSVSASGNAIVVSVTGMNNQGTTQTCAGASVDFDLPGAFCGQEGPANLTLSPLTCNRVGTHTVFVKVLDSTTGGKYEVRQGTVDVAPPPVSCPLFSVFALTRTNTVLTHKFGSEDWPLGQNHDAQTEILFQPIRIDFGTTIYARVLDPEDPSTYRSSVAKPGDNLDSAAGTLSDSPYPLGAKSISFQVGTGVQKLYLNTTRYAAGDNYIVQVSADARLMSDPAFSCDPATDCRQTAPITAWKRVYLEKHDMFRSGVLIDEAAASGANVISIQIPERASWKQVRIDRGDTIRLMHAPRLDGLDFYGSDFHSEDAVVTAVDRVRGRRERRLITLAQPIRYSYDLDRTYTNALHDGVADGVGSLAGGVFERNDSYLRAGFDSAYVEFWPLEGKVREIPFVPIVRGPRSLANKWFENTTVSLFNLARPGNPNVKHVLTGTGVDLTNSNDITLEEWGSTGVETAASNPGANYSWTWVAAIERSVRQRNNDPKFDVYGADPRIINGENLVHELTHAFSVNSFVYYGGDFGHCDNAMKTKLALNCTMRSSQSPAFVRKERADGIVGFHWNGDFDSEYMTIRTATEPILTPRM